MKNKGNTLYINMHYLFKQMNQEKKYFNSLTAFGGHDCQLFDTRPLVLSKFTNF